MTLDIAGEFVVIDVETANVNRDSICQIGIVAFCNGEIVDEWSTYVDPECPFYDFNIAIHGITPQMVRGAPNFGRIWAKLDQLLSQCHVLSYSLFDKQAINMSCERYGLAIIDCEWVDVMKMARRTWEDVSVKGYGLKKVSRMLGIDMVKHHDALSDARVAGQIAIEAIRTSQIAFADWPTKLAKAAKAANYNPIVLARACLEDTAIPENGPLAGEVIVFTGALSLPRREAMRQALLVGAKVAESVNRKTTMLVVGVQDKEKINGEDKSSKHRKAEEIVANGGEISIITEDDFVRFVYDELIE